MEELKYGIELSNRLFDLMDIGEMTGMVWILKGKKLKKGLIDKGTQQSDKIRRIFNKKKNERTEGFPWKKHPEGASELIWLNYITILLQEIR